MDMNTFFNGVDPCLFPDWSYFLANYQRFRQQFADFVAVNQLKFADPVTWAATTYYSPNTIVEYNNRAYVSTKDTPAGITPQNADYWLMIGDYDAQVQALREDLESGYYSTRALYRYPRTGFPVNSQADFDNYIHLFESGYTSRNCTISTSGVYKFPQRAVFNGFQMHIEPTVSGVVIDLNGCIFYNGHINFVGTSAHKISVTDSYVSSSVVGDLHNPGHFEDCSLLASYVEFHTLIRCWGGWSYFSHCDWLDYATSDGAINTSISCDTAVDCIGGKMQFVYCQFLFDTIPANHSVFGFGDNATMWFTSRIVVWDTNNGGTMFKKRQDGRASIIWDGSFLGYNRSTAAYSASNRGKWDSLIPVTNAPVNIQTLPENKIFWCAKTASVSYAQMNLTHFDTFVAP